MDKKRIESFSIVHGEETHMHRVLWIALAVVVYPSLLFGTCLIAMMPPLNIFVLPPWLAIVMGAVGPIANGISEADQRESSRRRKAPGDAPVQRTNALWKAL